MFGNAKLVILDFDGVLTNNQVYVNQDGLEMVCCSRSDGLGISRLKQVNIPVWIVSTETNPVVASRAKKIGVPCVSGVKDKAQAILKIAEKLNISCEEIVFIGNDINDIPALTLVGYPVGVSDCFAEIDSYICYKTTKSGGMGAVREVCDLIYFMKLKEKP